MQIKKAGGRIYGAVLTNAEKKAMDMEIKRQLAEMDKKKYGGSRCGCPICSDD